MSPRTSLPMHLEYALLGLIRKEPVHAYDILQHWNSNLGIIWRVKPGSLYAVLHKLTQLGYLSVIIIDNEKLPDRKIFQISDQGEQAFLFWMSTPVNMPREFRQEFFAKLFFARDVPEGIVSALLTAQIETCKRWTAQQREIKLTDSEFEAQVRDFRLSQIEDILAYLIKLSKTFLKE